MRCRSMGFSVVFSDLSKFHQNTRFLSKFQLNRIKIQKTVKDMKKLMQFATFKILQGSK